MPELNREYTWAHGLHTYMIRSWGEDDDLLCLEYMNTGQLLRVSQLLEHLSRVTTYPGFRYIDEHPDV